MSMLAKLSAKFPAEDIEWRVSRAGMGRNGQPFCMVLAYITARAVYSRLDEVFGPDGWKTEEPRILTIDGKSAFACGLTVRTTVTFEFDRDDSHKCNATSDWVTKWDVSSPTNIEPAKGGWSGAVKRAAAQLGIGRYLYHLPDMFAEVSESPIEGARDWNFARLPEKHGGGIYYWKTPTLPGWALPADDPEHEITEQELGGLKVAWKRAFGSSDEAGPKVLREGFALFCKAVVGDFPANDYTCWTREALAKCQAKIDEGPAAGGVDSEIPFGE